jgi:hypothetical protein
MLARTALMGWGLRAYEVFDALERDGGVVESRVV